jgi:hypothetical protein
MSEVPDAAPGGREREPLRASSRYSLYVGLAFLLLVVVATLNTFQTQESGVLGADLTEAGTALPEFAVPELLGGPDGDANIYQDDCATAENPCPAEQRRVPACALELERVIRVCDLFERPLVLSFWFSNPSDCPPTQDVIEAAYRRFGGRVNFLSIAIRGERPELEKIASERGWRMPLGWDRDGAVSNLLRVGLCPTVAYVLPGGILHEAKIGANELTAQRTAADIRALLSESARRAEAVR